MTVQLDRLPALASLCDSVGGKLQVACAPACRGAWELLPQLEKIIPFDFEADPSLADWANLLGCVREPDFQVCLNFAEGQQVNLMLSMSHIPTRLAPSGFSSTQRVSPSNGWPAQSLEAYLQPLGVGLDANGFRLSLSSADLDAARTELPPGDGPCCCWLRTAARTTGRSSAGRPFPRPSPAASTGCDLAASAQGSPCAAAPLPWPVPMLCSAAAP